MKPTKIEFSFDDAKLEAINLFLKDKDSKLSDELDHFMDGLYKKYVPQQVREFIEKKEAETAQAVSPTRNSRRKKEAGAVAPVCDDVTKGKSGSALRRKPRVSPRKASCGQMRRPGADTR